MITDPQAVKFCNEVIRPLCDTLASAKRQGDAALETWSAKGLSAIVTNTADVVDDGSATDGRTPITGADVNNLIAILGGLKIALEANGGAEIGLIHKVAVNIR